MKNFPDVTTFLSLPKGKQTFALATLFISRCCNADEVRKKKYTSTLIPIRNFFTKQGTGDLCKMYDWLVSLGDSNTPMSMRDAALAARKHEENRRVKREEGLKGETKEYLAYDTFLNERLASL